LTVSCSRETLNAGNVMFVLWGVSALSLLPNYQTARRHISRHRCFVCSVRAPHVCSTKNTAEPAVQSRSFSSNPFTATRQESQAFRGKCGRSSIQKSPWLEHEQNWPGLLLAALRLCVQTVRIAYYSN